MPFSATMRGAPLASAEHAINCHTTHRHRGRHRDLLSHAPEHWQCNRLSACSPTTLEEVLPCFGGANIAQSPGIHQTRRRCCRRRRHHSCKLPYGSCAKVFRSQRSQKQRQRSIFSSLELRKCQQCTHAPLAATAKVVKSAAAAVPAAVGKAPATPAATTATAAAVAVPGDSAVRLCSALLQMPPGTETPT